MVVGLYFVAAVSLAAQLQELRQTYAQAMQNCYVGGMMVGIIRQDLADNPSDKGLTKEESNEAERMRHACFVRATDEPGVISNKGE
jgi:hypothetical protein